MASPRLLLFAALAPALALPPPSAAWPVFAAPNGSAAPTEVTLLAVLPENYLFYPWAWQRVLPALSLAHQALEPELQEAGLSVHIAFAYPQLNGDCSEDLVGQIAVELQASHDPDLLLGLGCSLPNFFTQFWASRLGLPLLTTGFYYRELEFSTAMYTGPTWLELSVFLTLLHRHFNWNSRAALFVSQQTRIFDRYHNVLRIERKSFSNFTSHVNFYYPPEEAVRFIRDNGRVVYISGGPEMLQHIMHLMQAQNMTNGDYAVFYLDISGEILKAKGHRKAAKPWQSTEGQYAGDLREAFQVVQVITSHEPQTPEYQHFQNQLILRAQRNSGVALNDALLENLVAGCFHDGLVLYIRALNETLHEGGTKRDTSRILEKMRSLKIQGVTGTVSINNKSVRETDFDLWSMVDVESGTYQVVVHYVGPEKRINWTGPIHWKKVGPPLDNPFCIFDVDDPSCDIQKKESFNGDWIPCY